MIVRLREAGRPWIVKMATAAPAKRRLHASPAEVAQMEAAIRSYLSMTQKTMVDFKEDAVSGLFRKYAEEHSTAQAEMFDIIGWYLAGSPAPIPAFGEAGVYAILSGLDRWFARTM